MWLHIHQPDVAQAQMEAAKREENEQLKRTLLDLGGEIA